jgi:hypothetical protein
MRPPPFFRQGKQKAAAIQFRLRTNAGLKPLLKKKQNPRAAWATIKSGRVGFRCANLFDGSL